LVRDAQGRKMSKTTGNVIDPLEMTGTYGTDALRFSLLTGSTPGNDINLSEERIVAGRNFANKLWNITRFVINNCSGVTPIRDESEIDFSSLSLPMRAVVSRQNELIETVTTLMETYQYGEAGRQLHEFIWSRFADWDIEAAKTQLEGDDALARIQVVQILVYVLERCLRLLHPYMPFVTEAAWQHLPQTGDSLMIAKWPEPGFRDDEAEAGMQTIMRVVRAIRNARSEHNVEPSRRIEAVIVAGDSAEALRSNHTVLARLARLNVETLQITSVLDTKPDNALTLMVGSIEIYLPLAGMVDLETEKKRLQKELAHVQSSIQRSEQILANEKFVSKAPAAVVQKERDKLVELQDQVSNLAERLRALEGS